MFFYWLYLSVGSNPGAQRGAGRELGPRGAWVASQARDGKNNVFFFSRVILVT